MDPTTQTTTNHDEIESNSVAAHHAADEESGAISSASPPLKRARHDDDEASPSAGGNYRLTSRQKAIRKPPTPRPPPPMKKLGPTGPPSLWKKAALLELSLEMLGRYELALHAAESCTITTFRDTDEIQAAVKAAFAQRKDFFIPPALTRAVEELTSRQKIQAYKKHIQGIRHDKLEDVSSLFKASPSMLLYDFLDHAKRYNKGILDLRSETKEKEANYQDYQFSDEKMSMIRAAMSEYGLSANRMPALLNVLAPFYLERTLFVEEIPSSSTILVRKNRLDLIDGFLAASGKPRPQFKNVPKAKSKYQLAYIGDEAWKAAARYAPDNLRKNLTKEQLVACATKTLNCSVAARAKATRLDAPPQDATTTTTTTAAAWGTAELTSASSSPESGFAKENESSTMQSAIASAVLNDAKEPWIYDSE